MAAEFAQYGYRSNFIQLLSGLMAISTTGILQIKNLGMSRTGKVTMVTMATMISLAQFNKIA